MNFGFGTLPKIETVYSRLGQMQELALAEKVKVGCIVEGFRAGALPIDFQYFGGANMEFSKTDLYHAEEVAILDCVMHRYYPVRLFVTSQSKEENVFTCGHCRQLLLEINKKCEIIVMNPDMTVKGIKSLSSLLPNHKDVDKDNKNFQKMCNAETYNYDQ